MTEDHHHIERSTTQARQGVAVPPMRYVLGFGILGVIIGFLIAWVVIS